MQKVISGIQQIGIGVPQVHEAWAWYRHYFGMNIPIFEEAAEARLMIPYTGGQVQSRHAVLAINLQGGAGFEIWQYTSRQPQAATFAPQIGDYGIYACKIKCPDVNAAYHFFRQNKLNLVGELTPDPAGQPQFFVRDPYGNLFQVMQRSDWFSRGKNVTGGAGGCIIGVSNVERSRALYSTILGYDEVVYDKQDVFPDLAPLPGGKCPLRRVLLRHSQPRQGCFSRLLGPSEIELVTVQNRQPQKIYANRYWGDLGFIHLCFDIAGMDVLEQECQESGFQFTINSNQTFNMGEAAGHFAYIEDPDGTLIEFVETHKIPILKKLGWYLNLKNRPRHKALPDWLLQTLTWNKVKN